MTAALALPTFRLRAELPDDRRYVLATWGRSDADIYGKGEGPLFGSLQARMMEEILSRPNVATSVVSPSDDDAIAGWAVVTKLKAPETYDHVVAIVHHVFVRKEARRLGIARLLLADLLGRHDVAYTTKPPHGILAPYMWRFIPRANFYPLEAA